MKSNQLKEHTHEVNYNLSICIKDIDDMHKLNVYPNPKNYHIDYDNGWLSILAWHVQRALNNMINQDKLVDRFNGFDSLINTKNSRKKLFS